jgi:hypothetical protein
VSRRDEIAMSDEAVEPFGRELFVKHTGAGALDALAPEISDSAPERRGRAGTG